MASKQRSLGISSRSEQRKGFTMPTLKRIKSVLRTRSKTFIINLFMMAFSKLSKTQKISMLMKIESGKISKAVRKAKRKTKKLKSKTKKTKNKTKKTKNKQRGFQGKPKGSKAEKRAIAKARKNRKR